MVLLIHWEMIIVTFVIIKDLINDQPINLVRDEILVILVIDVMLILDVNDIINDNDGVENHDLNEGNKVESHRVVSEEIKDENYNDVN